MLIRQLRQLPLLTQIWQRLEAMPLPQVEDSILLRILVQVLVIVGIIATDIAGETQMSVWAVPLSIAGAIWSWHHRRKRNVTVKFLLAMGMLLALLVFFGNLLGSLNDTRLVLAQLLIQLQVLHSFDLPRRKDLGYSAIIGLILLGVAGTVSQTLAFGPFLLIFLAIALPTLVLDYRSRLGLESINLAWPFSRNRGTGPRQSDRPPNLNYSPLSPGRLSSFLTLILLLGLLIFALMPRFPGYQFQTFPVSGSGDLQNQRFNNQNRGIMNPGYVREGEAGRGENEAAEAGESNSGQVDPTYYYGFNSKMNQNLRGLMKRKMVMRVRSQSPGFWRVLAFDRYTGQGWEISREDKLNNVKRPNWSYRFFLSSAPTIGRKKNVVQTYTAVTELPNLLPSLSYPKYLFFPSQEIAIDTEGGLRSPAGLDEGTTYTIISQVPYRDRTRLRQASESYSEGVKTYYLQIPPEIEEKVRQQAEALLAKSPKTLTSPYEKALFLAQAIKQNYRIQTDIPLFEEGEDLVEAFLFRYQGGHPDHFSTVLTVMLRSIGIPARLTVGYAPGQFNPFTGYYIVHNTDAYALTEVYFPEYGWFAFDPIPGHELIPPSVEDSQIFGVLGQLWQWVAGWVPSPIASFVATLWREVMGGLWRFFGWVWRFVSGSLIGWLVGAVSAIALWFLAWLGWQQLRGWNYRRRLKKLAPMERLYRQMLDTLKTNGYPKHPAQTPLEYADILQKNYPTPVVKIVEEICQAYVCWRYGGQAQNLDYLQQQLKLMVGTKLRLR